MFGWRKRQIAERVAKDIEDSTEPKVEFDGSESIYTVGKNKAGHTQLRINLDYGSTTLTMGPEAVVDMIEQLSVTIRKQYKVEVTKISDDVS